jgi:predicted dehydrogenase
MNETLAAIVVGCGSVGSEYDADREGQPPLSHAGAYSAHSATKLVAGVDPDPEARSRFEQHWNVPCHAELGPALSEHHPALVSVCTPPESHPDAVGQAAAAGTRGIWVEKPLAPSHALGVELVANAERLGAALQVNFIRRFDPLHRRVAEVLRSPDNALAHADVRYSGSLSNFGSHAIDLVRWFAGEVAWVRVSPGPEGEPILFLGSESGMTASLYRVGSATTEIFEAYLFTNGGLMTLTGLGEDLSTWAPMPSELFRGVTRIGTPRVDTQKGLANAMLEGVESMVSHVTSGTPLLCDGADGLAALAIHEAAEESVRTGELVRLS